MTEVSPLPLHGEVLIDARQDGRELRVSWPENGQILLLSLWRRGVCTGPIRLNRADVPALSTALIAGLVADDDTHLELSQAS